MGVFSEDFTVYRGYDFNIRMSDIFVKICTYYFLASVMFNYCILFHIDLVYFVTPCGYNPKLSFHFNRKL